MLRICSESIILIAVNKPKFFSIYSSLNKHLPYPNITAIILPLILTNSIALFDVLSSISIFSVPKSSSQVTHSGFLCELCATTIIPSRLPSFRNCIRCTLVFSFIHHSKLVTYSFIKKIVKLYVFPAITTPFFDTSFEQLT